MNAALTRLDKHISCLGEFEHLLERNVHYTEFEIKATFDRLLADLHTRRQELLDQAHSNAADKRAQIKSQKEVAESLRSLLRTFSLQLNPSSSSWINRTGDADQVNEYIEKANIMTQSLPEISPFVAFRSGDLSRLRRSLGSFGRIVSTYAGHFADPMLPPSACLPREFEASDEDDNDAGGIMLSDARSVSSALLLRRRTRLQNTRDGEDVSCSCVKPELREWLAPDSHTCCCRPSQEDTMPSTDVDRQARACRKISHASSYSFDLMDDPMTSPPSVASSAAGCSIRQPAAQCGSSSITDWLFDHTAKLKLSDLPGYHHQCQEGQFSATHSTSTTAGDHPAVVQLRQLVAAPNDLDKWLAPESRVDQNEAAEGALDSAASSPEIVDRDQEVMLSSAAASAPLPPCVYSVCRGGPGGPTCCMATTDRPSQQASVISEKPLDDASLAGKQMIDETRVPFRKASLLNAEEDLTQWLVPTTCVKVNREKSQQQQQVSFWLHPASVSSCEQSSS